MYTRRKYFLTSAKHFLFVTWLTTRPRHYKEMKLKMILPKGISLVGRWEKNASARAHDTKKLCARERYNPVFEYYHLVPRATVPFLTEANALINSKKFHGHLRNSSHRFLSFNLPFDRGFSILFPHFIRTSVERCVLNVVHFETGRSIPPRREKNNSRWNVTSARPPMQRQ